MMIPMYLRIAVPIAVLAGVYCLWDDYVRSPEELTGPGPVRSMQTFPKQVAASGALQEQRLSGPDIDLFPDQRMAPAAVAEPTAVAGLPLSVRPPPLPFQVNGVWVEGPQRKIILNDGSKTIILCQRCEDTSSLGEGGLIDGKYRIEKIDNEQITLTYLPLQIKQVVRLDKAMADTGT